MKILCELIVERDGKQIYRGKSKSFLLNIAKVFAALFSAPGGTGNTVPGPITSTTVTDTGGSSTTAYGEWYDGAYNNGRGGHMLLGAGDNDDSFGIQVGLGSTPVSPSDYKLASKITHGTGSGQLDYDPQTVTTSYAADTSYVEIARVFLNKSGGDIVVREVGLVARQYWRDDTAVRVDVKYMIARDVLPAPVKVKPLGSLTVRYRVSLST